MYNGNTRKIKKKEAQVIFETIMTENVTELVPPPNHRCRKLREYQPIKIFKKLQLGLSFSK